jgi:lipopolysaccharide transport system permease protein
MNPIDSQKVHEIEPLEEILYSSESQLRRPFTLFKQMWKDLYASRELAMRLLIRDTAAKYRQSLLGFLWIFIPPLATAGIFIVLNQQAILTVQQTDIPYPAFALIGAVLWQTFVDSLQAPLKSVTAAKSILAKIKFPYEALLLSAIGEALLNLSLKMLILIVVFIVFKIPVTIGLLLSPFAILMLVLLGAFIGLLLTPIGILYTDIYNALMIGTNLWLFITPVVYPTPQQFPFSVLVMVNPVSPLLVGARDLMTKGMIENVPSFVAVSLVSLVGLIFVWIVYRLSIPILIERISA